MKRACGIALTALLSLMACGESDSGNARDRSDAGAGKSGSSSGGQSGTGKGGTAGSAASGGSSGTGGSAASSGSSGTGGGAGNGGSSASGGSAGSSAGNGGSAGSGGSSGSGGSAGSAGSAGVAGGAGAGGSSSPGLRVQGNRILGPDGRPFHGRGANLHDTRSCNACTYLDPDVQGLNRWADELIDRWHANFIRFDLSAWPDDAGYRRQWRRLVDDPVYLADVKTAVAHMTSKPGVYVMVTLFSDPSIKDNLSGYDAEWPTAETLPVYRALAEAFYANPKVLFGLTNEPQGPVERNPELLQRYLDSIDAIRAVERSHAAPEHVVVVQAPQSWARFLDWFVANPIQRSNIAYEVHVYNPQSDFDRMLTQPARALPILIGEYGPAMMTNADIQALWTLCKSLEIPHIAWNFHHRCPPNMLVDPGGCGFESSYTFGRTAWGDMFRTYLATAW